MPYGQGPCLYLHLTPTASSPCSVSGPFTTRIDNLVLIPGGRLRLVQRYLQRAASDNLCRLPAERPLPALCAVPSASEARVPLGLAGWLGIPSFGSTLFERSACGCPTRRVRRTRSYSDANTWRNIRQKGRLLVRVRASAKCPRLVARVDGAPNKSGGALRAGLWA